MCPSVQNNESPTQPEAKINKSQYKHMELSPCLIPTSLNNRVSCVHVNADRQTERPCLTEETDERLDCQATQKLSALFQEEHERVRMYTRVFMQVCTCCEQRGDLARQ